MLLPGCSDGGAGERVEQDPASGSASRSAAADDGARDAAAVPPLRLAADVPRRARAQVRAFVAFAADPRPATGRRVRFATPMTLRVDDRDRGLRTTEKMFDPRAWSSSTVEGTASPLSVLGGRVGTDQAAGGLATTRRVPLCDLAEQEGAGVLEASVYLVREPRGRCAEGFRVRLGFTRSAAIRTVDLSLRAS